MNNLHEVLRLIFGKSECWHALLERHCSNPMEPPTINPTMCGGTCPHCLKIRKKYIMKVRKDGLKSFLLSTFLGTSSNDKYPSYVFNELKQYPRVRWVIYNRPKSISPPDTRYLESTILQLLASKILSLKINDNAGKGQLVLNFRMEDSMPCYMIDSYWDHMNIVPDSELVNI